MRGLYAIVDWDALGARGIDPVAFAAALAAGGARTVQVRAKHTGAQATLTGLRRIRAQLDREIAVYANDRVDLALLAEVDGVHVGQEDPTVADVRQLSSGLRIGVSTHDLEQLDAALAARPSYVAFGPVFATASKDRPDPVVGLEGLARASERARRAGVPLVAIGGIDAERVSSVAPLVEAVALISALIPRDGDLRAAERAARHFVRAFEGGP